MWQMLIIKQNVLFQLYSFLVLPLLYDKIN
jgi:hypothetical protein